MIRVEIVRISDDKILDAVTGDDRDRVEAEARRKQPVGSYLRRVVPACTKKSNNN